MKPKSIDELGNACPGSFRKFLKDQKDELRAQEARRRERIKAAKQKKTN